MSTRVQVLSTGLVAGESPMGRIVDGDGARFVLADGRQVIDASNTAAPLGHCHPALVEAARRAAASPVVNEGWAWDDRRLAAHDLREVAFAGEEWVGGVRFFLSGSEANDAALSLAQALTGRVALVTRERAYHGGSGLARDMTVQPQWHGGVSSIRGGWRAVPRTAPVRELPRPGCGVHARHEPCACAPEAATILRDAAAVILDYSQGGIYPAPDYQDEIARAARGAGALWIADEVVTGLGRQGRWLNLQRGAERPDIVTLGKPLAGGVAAAGAVVLSRRVMEELRDQSWRSYSTFRGHPIMVAGLRATLRTIRDEGLVERAESFDAPIRRRLKEIQAAHPSVRSVDGLGLHWTVELHGGDWRDWHADTAEQPIASRVLEAALEKDVLISTSGEETSLFLAPPLVAREDEIERILDALDHGLLVADRELAAAA